MKKNAHTGWYGRETEYFSENVFSRFRYHIRFFTNILLLDIIIAIFSIIGIILYRITLYNTHYL